MGVIQRQGFKNSLIGMFGVAIGAVATIFIYPKALEVYGLVRFLIDTSVILSPILILGIHSLPLKFYNEIRGNEGAGNGFLSFLLLLLIIAIFLFCILFIFLKDLIRPLMLVDLMDNDILRQNFNLIFPISVLGALSLFFTQYINIFKRIAVPAIFNNLFQKLGVATLILLYITGTLSTQQVSYGVVLVFLVICICLMGYLYSLNEFRIEKINFELFFGLRKKFISYALFSILGTVGYLIAFRIDSIMVSALVGLKDNGAYNIGLFIGASISIPDLAVRSISAPMISEWLHKSQYDKVAELYKKSSINLSIVGIGLFILIISSLNDLLNILPSEKEFSSLYQIVLFLGLARIIDMSLGIKNQIILYSDYYRFALYTILILAVSNVFLNLFFISFLDLEMTGAALATCVSFLLVNLIYFFYIYFKFSMQPFTMASLRLLLICLFMIVLGYFFRLDFHPILNIFIRSSILLVIYVVLVYRLDLSEDSKNIINKYLWKYLR